MHRMGDAHVAQGDMQLRQLVEDWYVVGRHSFMHSPMYSIYFMQIDPKIFFYAHTVLEDAFINNIDLHLVQYVVEPSQVSHG